MSAKSFKDQMNNFNNAAKGDAPKMPDKSSNSTPYRLVLEVVRNGKSYALPVSLDIGNAINYADTWVENMKPEQIEGHARGLEIMQILDSIEENAELTDDMLEDVQFKVKMFKGEDKERKVENARASLASLVSIPKLK